METLAINKQDEFDMLMIRDDFINYPTTIKEKIIHIVKKSY